MKSFRKAYIVALLGLLAFAPFASARVFIRGGYGPVWVGPPVYAYGPYPYAYPYAYGYPAEIRYTGKLKIKNAMKGESIYIDGGFVGVTGKVNSIPLSAGTHDVQVRDAGGNTFYQEKVNIIGGRTTEIHPDSGSPS